MNQGLDPTPFDGRPIPTKAYSPGQIAGATFLGSPIAGCLLLASNFTLFGSQSGRSLALIWGTLGTIALFIGVAYLPESTPNSLLPAIYTVALQQIAQRTQGANYGAFIEAGGHKHSHWRVFGIGLLCLVVVFAVFFAVLLALPDGTLGEPAA